MARRKAAAQAAPQTFADAVLLLTRFSVITAAIEQIEADADVAVAEIRAACDNRTAPFEAELKEIFAQLKPWWAVAGGDITDGERRSAELAGCLIGVRLSNPKLIFNGKALDKNSEPAAIAAIEKADGLGDFLRIKTELDKPKLLGAVAEKNKAVTSIGFGRRQRDEFFIDRLPPKQPDTIEIVEEEAGA